MKLKNSTQSKQIPTSSPTRSEIFILVNEFDGKVLARKGDFVLDFTSVCAAPLPAVRNKLVEELIQVSQNPKQTLLAVHEGQCVNVIDFAFKLIEEPDIACMMELVDLKSVDGALAFVMDNYDFLKEHDFYEEAMVHAYACGRHTHYKWDYSTLRMLISSCDRTKSINCGDPLPKGKTFTLYRGVAGPPSVRRVKGFSWSLDPVAAARFAERAARKGGWHNPKPAIYRTVVPRESIYWYFNERNEQEIVLLDPGKITTYIKDREKIEAMVREYEASKN